MKRVVLHMMAAALLASTGCLLDIPAENQAQFFACESDDDCESGFSCVQSFCAAPGTTGGDSDSPGDNATVDSDPGDGPIVVGDSSSPSSDSDDGRDFDDDGAPLPGDGAGDTTPGDTYVNNGRGD